MVVTDTLDHAVAPDTSLWVSFEDHGPAAKHADLVINALYPKVLGAGNEVGGPDWAVLRPEFQALPPFEVRDQATRILVMFGGTDPAELHNLVGPALMTKATPFHAAADVYLPANWDITTVTPGEPVPVAATMRDHDILITSAGRTVYEAAAVGIPTIVMAQNNREATHAHLGPSHGNIFLGLGRMVTAEQLRHTAEQLAGDVQLRRELSATARASIDGLGLARIVHAIDGLLEGL
jgi:spore coat polysaccharide biosynthesis predicted glycosyltransferase SpsG